MKLSILICSHESRQPLCCRMVENLQRQILDHGLMMGVEVLVQVNKSVMARGSDRNKLLDKASGKYCCFVDDDDVVELNYVPAIIEYIFNHKDNNVDVFGLRGVVTSLHTNESKAFELSSKYNEIFRLPSDNFIDNTYKRFISHLNPIKTSIAQKIRFPKDNINEDNGYTERLKAYHQANPLKEVMMQNPLYFYFNRCHITSTGVRT